MEAFYSLQGSAFGKTIVYDLVFTDRRVVGLVYGSASGGATGSVVASNLLTEEAHRTRGEYRPEDLDALVAKHPKSFSFPYANVEDAAIKGVLERAVRIRSGRRKVLVHVPPYQLPRMATILARTMPRGHG